MRGPLFLVVLIGFLVIGYPIDAIASDGLVDRLKDISFDNTIVPQHLESRHIAFITS